MMVKKFLMLAIPISLLAIVVVGAVGAEAWVGDVIANIYPSAKYGSVDTQVAQKLAPVVDDAAAAVGETDVPDCVASLAPNNSGGEAVWWWCSNGTASTSYSNALHGDIVTASMANDEPAMNSAGYYSVYTLYKWPNKGGNVFNGVTTWSAGCSDGSEYWMANYSSYSWPNVTSSMEAVGTCGELTGYSDTSYSGASYVASPYASSLGDFDNSLESSKAKK